MESFLFSDFTQVVFTESVEQDSDVEMACLYGYIPRLKQLIWYRERTTGDPEKIVTINYGRKAEVEIHDKFYGRIFIPGRQASKTQHRIILVKVMPSDISRYWCEVEPDQYQLWHRSELNIKGLNILLSTYKQFEHFAKIFTCFTITIESTLVT